MIKGTCFGASHFWISTFVPKWGFVVVVWGGRVGRITQTPNRLIPNLKVLDKREHLCCLQVPMSTLTFQCSNTY